MRLINKDYKNGSCRLVVENLDDLWYLTYIIEKGDFLKAKTFRKIKLGGSDDRKSEVIKKPVTIKIQVDKVEFAKYSNILRASGVVSEGPEDIPLGSHHTIGLEEGTEFALEKKKFLRYQIDKLEESIQESKDKILIIVHDREEAYFALLKKYGFEILSELKGNVTKKADVKVESNDFFGQINQNILDYDTRYNFGSIIIASPGFWKDYMQKEITDPKLKKKVFYATCSSASINGINEVIRRPEVATVLKQEKFAKESTIVETLLTEISLTGKAEYGIKNIKKAIENGAVSVLLITDSLIHKRRQEDTFAEIEHIMREAEAANGEICIISSEHEGGKKLDGLGGMGALLRYKMTY
jgi:protein pelota